MRLVLLVLLVLGAVLLVALRRPETSMGSRAETSFRPPSWYCAEAGDARSYDYTFNKLLAGEGGWLYRRLELTEVFPLTLEADVYLSRLATALRSRGIEPIVLVLPRRALMNPAMLPPDVPFDDLAAARYYRSYLARLRAAGFIAPDVLEWARSVGLAESFFFKRDHHWTPEGAQLVAQNLAALVRELPVYASLPRVPHATVTDGTIEFYGSFAGTIASLCGEHPPLEVRPRYRTFSEGGDLFAATPDPQVLVLGTSMTEEANFNFTGFLQEALATEVFTFSVTGGERFGSLQGYFLSDEAAAGTPRVLVWEFEHSSFGADSPLSFRQVIPAVYGACSANEAAFTSTISTGEEVNFAPQTFSGQDYFLYLETPDRTRYDLPLELFYETTTERVRLELSRRLRSNGRFFLEIPANLTLRGLRLPEGAADEALRLKVCRVPPREGLAVRP